MGGLAFVLTPQAQAVVISAQANVSKHIIYIFIYRVLSVEWLSKLFMPALWNGAPGMWVQVFSVGFFDQALDYISINDAFQFSTSIGSDILNMGQ